MDFNAGYYQGVMKTRGISLVVRVCSPLDPALVGHLRSQRPDLQRSQRPGADAGRGQCQPVPARRRGLGYESQLYRLLHAGGCGRARGNRRQQCADPAADRTNDRIYITMRSYWSQPGYPRVGGLTPTIQAVSAADPTQPITCPGLGFGEGAFPLAPFTIPGAGIRQDSLLPPAQQHHSDGGWYEDSRFEWLYRLCHGPLGNTDLNLIKLHKAPVFPDNQKLYRRQRVVDDFEVRYVGLEANGATVLGSRSDVAMNEITVQADGSAIILTIPRPSDLDAQTRLAVIEKGRANNWNIMPSAGEGADMTPFLTYRNKLADASFPYAIAAIPCFGPDLGEWSEATSDYASSPENMGEYYIDGVICSADELLSGACEQQLAGE